MKKTILCIILALVSVFCLTLGACAKEPEGPVANAELEEYNQIVNQMKDVFTPTSNQPQPMSSMGINGFNSTVTFESSQENEISTMFTMMNNDSTKEISLDDDYYAYGIDFSTMTARIAGYAANNFFRVSSFYGLNILMDYGGNTVINASVEKEGNVIKTYLFTTYKNTRNELFKEYNYAEINFTSQTDFNILVVDYSYDEQDNITSQTMIYASNDKDFFLLSGDIDNPRTGMVFFDLGESTPAYVLEGVKTSTIDSLFGIMSQKFALSSQDKAKIGGLYNTQDYSINYSQVTQAKTDLGILINTDSEEYVPPIGFVSNKNAEDLVGRKTLQGFVDDGESVDGTTLTIPSEFNYLSGGIYFDANIDTLVIPSTIKGVVVYDRFGNYYNLDDSLCYYEPADEYDAGMYRAWGGTLFSYVSDPNGEFWIDNTKPFKKYILLDDSGKSVTETDAFALDEIGNLWIKDSNGNKNYLWGFVSEPAEDADTIYLPSPIFVTKDRYIQVERFAGQTFMDGLKNIGKMDEYSAHFKHAVIDAYVVEQSNPQTGLMPGFCLLRNPFFVSFEYEEIGMMGFKWDLETLTINNVIDGATVSLLDVFCSESGRLDEYGYPCGDTVCQAKIKKVILNGDFESITYINGYCEIPRPTFIPGGNGIGTVRPNDSYEITSTFAISEDFELNGRENAHFSYDSVVYGKKVVEIYDDEHQLPTFPDAETLLIKSSVTQLSINHSLLQIGMYSMPEDRKLTIEFENIAGIEFDRFYINDFMWHDSNMWQDSNRVEKIKFNASEAYMERLLASLEWNPYASWLSEAINSDMYEIEYGTPHPAENEFLANFDFNDGYVSKKETNTATTFEINDEFLSLVKQITGKELRDLNLGGGYETNVKVILNISKEYLDNSGVIPYVSGVNVVEIASQMKEFDDLTVFLDRINPIGNTKLIFNGTKQELTSRTHGLGEAYITRLLYAEYYYYEEIVFSDNETIYRGFGNSTLTYEDEKIKLSITFVDGVGTEYHFEDKLNPSVSYTGENNNTNDYDDNFIYWTISIGLYMLDGESTTYEDLTITVPNYELAISYTYGENEDYSLIYVYGTPDSYYSVQFGINSLPPTLTLS